MNRAWKTSTTPATRGRQAEISCSAVMQGTYKTGRGEARQSHSMTSESAPVRFDTKIAVLLRDDLQTWQRLNVTAFLVSGLGTELPETIGEPYADADGTGYLPLFRQPVLVFEGSKEVLKSAHSRVLGRDLPRAVFIGDMFSTGHDEDNRAAVRAVHGADLDLVGLAVYGPRNAVDKVLKGARMHP
ncbi:hypothetical protein GCM10010331_21940 [Streptomyces xanthochromogenes]|nr:hypothetical protein GCM10010331_21940 [Streptomyces xanthochromogenes]